jgi:hypothetical protein
MTYLLLAFSGETPPEAQSASEGEAFLRACLAHAAALRESGYLLAAARLPDSAAATRVQMQAGEWTLSEAPPGGDRDHLTALFLVSARDLNEAIRLAAQLPEAQRGAIEVRPAMDYTT